MVRKGRGFQPVKVTGAGFGYVKPSLDEENEDETLQSTKKKSPQQIAKEMSTGETFYRLKKQSGEIAADFSILESSSKAGGFTISIESLRGPKPTPGYVACLHALIRGVSLANGVIYDLRHQPRSLNGSVGAGRKVSVEFPIAIATESELEILVKRITSPTESIGNIKRKSITERIVMEVVFPDSLLLENFLERIIPHNGNLRKKLV